MNRAVQTRPLYAIVAAILCCSIIARAGLSQESKKENAPAKVRYRMPAIMMQAHVEWPKDPKLMNEMAQFIVASGFNSCEGGVENLDVCRAHGIKVVLPSDDATYKLAPKLKDDAAVFGYFVSDRKKSAAFPGFAATASKWEQVDPNHPTIFINYAVWNEFTRFNAEVKPMLLNFYHYHWDSRRYPDRYFIFLTMFRELGLKHGIPVMQCVASNDGAPRVRQTIFTSLAYGVQGFQFWPPWIFNYAHDGKGNATLKDGKLAPHVTIPYLPDIARDVRTLAPELIRLRSVAVFHADPLPPSGVKTKEDYWFRLAGNEVMVGEFEGEAKAKFLMPVNRDAGKAREAVLTFGVEVKGVEVMRRPSGKWESIPLTSTNGGRTATLKLEPGDGQLLRISTAPTGDAGKDEPKGKPEAKKPAAGYRVPEIMLVSGTLGDWPKEREDQDVLARFIRAKGFNSVEVEMDMLDMCRRNKLYARLGGDIDAMLKAAPMLKDDPAVFCYFISDRKPREAFPEFERITRAFEKADPNHPTMFINKAAYNQYDEFVKVVRPTLLSYYQYEWRGKADRPEFNFLFLRSFRGHALRNGIPLVRCVDSKATPAQVRQTHFTSLAYGVQGFHYSPSWHFDWKKDQGKPVLENGRIVPVALAGVEALSLIALDIKALSPELLKLKSVEVYHTEPLPVACLKAPKDLWFQMAGEKLLVGVFQDDQQRRYLMPVNHDVGKAQTATFRFKTAEKAVHRFDRKASRWVPLSLKEDGGSRVLEVTLAPGDGDLLRIEGGN